ncbi:MAG: response regulator transcription factor [Gemmatimonadaceae bacterium]
MADAIRRVLVAEHYSVDIARDGEMALDLTIQHTYDAVLLDRMLPGISGEQVLRTMRRRGNSTPVLMVTALSALEHRVEGLDAGADDYLPKPFEFAELLARVKALLRRSSLTAESAVMRVRDLSLDPISRHVERAGKEIELTQKEYALLEYLMRNMGRTVSRQMISEHVWRQQVDPLTNVVDVYINYLRKKLEEDREHPLIHTVRGSGYVLRDDAAPAPPASPAAPAARPE